MDFLSQLINSPGDLKQSVLNHLGFLLNTRQGSLSHLPLFGLPEFDSNRPMGHVKQTYTLALKALIEQYEPRLTEVFIEAIEDPTHDCILKFNLRARFKQTEPFHFSASLLSGGEITVLDNRMVSA